MWWQFVFCIVIPLLRGMARLVGRPADSIERYFVRLNNSAVMRRPIHVKPSELLLLVPHCVQRWECPNRLTATVYNCKRCGKCLIDTVIGLGEKYGVAIEVATGGGRAVRTVNEQTPAAVVAVACEHEMVDGIREALPRRVLGILNERPEGPCKNTVVDIAQVESAIRWFLNGKS